MDNEDHWITYVLDKASNLDKLTLDIRGIDPTNERFLQQHVNLSITHLTIVMHTNVRKCTQFVPPDFRNLTQSAIGRQSVTIQFFSIESIKRNDPEIES